MRTQLSFRLSAANGEILETEYNLLLIITMLKSIKLRLIVMNILQWAVWGSYLTSMGSYLASVGLATRIGIFYSMQGISHAHR